MQLEQLVPSLDLCKELKENGYPQWDSYFSWESPNTQWGWTDWVVVNEDAASAELEHIAAPTSAEIGEQLLSNLDEFIRDNLDDLSTELYFEWCDTEHPYYNPNLLAKLWLLFKKNGLLPQEDKTNV